MGYPPPVHPYPPVPQYPPPYPPPMAPRRWWLTRKWLLIFGIGIGLLTFILLFFLVIYGRIGAYMIRSKVVPKLEAKLGRTVEIGDVDVSTGLAVLEDVVIKGPRDKGEPLVRIARIEAEVGFWSSLVGNVDLGAVRIEGVKVAAVRDKDGDNFSDIVDRLRGKKKDGESSGGGGASKYRPESIALKDMNVQLRDSKHGVTVVAAGISANAGADGALALTLGDLALLTDIGPYANAEGVVVTANMKDLVHSASVVVASGEVYLWKGMTLTGMSGAVSQTEGQPGRLVVHLTGGYGGAQGTLWRADGWVDPVAEKGNLDIVADRFTFDRIAPVLEKSMVRDFDKTSIDVAVKIALEGPRVTFGGNLNLVGLNVFHPLLSEEVVKDISARGELAGTYDRTARSLAIDKAALQTRGVDYELTGKVEQPDGLKPDGTRRASRHVTLRLTIPPVPCQTMLDSIPPQLIPKMVGFQLKGKFGTDVLVDIDWANLEATRLEGSVGIRGCKVVKAPKEMDKKRLEGSFEHEIEVAPDKWETIKIGPESPHFVPILEVSPYIVSSLQTTEDNSFFRHHGFITKEFRTALVKDLQAGYFKYGASSITMQLVKNVLLTREKTLSRKFQELFLTWYVESILEKERLFEIYVNAIEFGPGLYGIKPATLQYFGKLPADINPREAAFFSSILPAPKRRYKQFCQDKLSGWTEAKIERILQLMVKRERLSEQDYLIAMQTPLVFQPNKKGFCDKKYPKWGIK
jgi:hypothetical protein